MSTATPDRPRRPRRARGAAESLGSIVLGFESVVVFLAGLAVFGLKVLPESVPSWWGIVGGVVVAVLMVAVAGQLRHRWAIAAGWALQVVVALAAILVPAIGVVALIFGAMWAYATIKGASLDARNARLAQDQATANGD